MLGEDFTGGLICALAHIPVFMPFLPLVPGKPRGKIGMPLQPTEVLKRIIFTFRERVIVNRPDKKSGG